MIWLFVGLQSALLAVTAACRRRATVLRSLAVQRPDNAGLRALSRSLAARTANATRLERAIASKASGVIRTFVQTHAFDQAVLASIAEFRHRLEKEVQK